MRRWRRKRAMTQASQTPLSLATPTTENVFSWGSCKAQKQELSMPHESPSTSASMGIYTMAFICRCLLLLLLGLRGPGLGNPIVKAAQLREHFIVAQVTSWNYRAQPADQSRSPNSEPLFQKIIYREYEADFRNEKPVNALSGLLGPTLRAEVGDKLIVHFKNLANKPLSIHPQGIAYNKQSEGSSYSDRTSPLEKLDDAVSSGQTYTYVWEIIEESGPRRADPPCLTYAYYSHVNIMQDFNSGLIGALLICKKGSLDENGRQKLFDREYVLMFAVFDESKSWKKDTSVMYTINGYANGTLPDVQACAFERISWHLIGMSSSPEIFSIHFNGQTLEQNHQRISTVSLVAGASATANMTVSQMGKWLISSLVQKHLQAGMYGYLNIMDCGNADILTRKLTLKELRMINNWDYFIAAEEIVWDYAPEIPGNIDREYKVQHLDNFSNIIGKKYKKAVFRQYKDATFSKRVEITRPNEVGILGPVIRAEVKDTVTITFKNMASRPYSIYVHGVTLSKAAEGAVYPSDSKENSTRGQAVQPGETYTYKWSVLDTDEPTTEDAQCITRSYHSAVDVTRDIASGLIGPLLICKRKALNKKGIQNKADVEQHAVFAVFDENKSWYLEDNIKEYCSNPSAVKRDDPKFYKSNIMHTLNGYVSERTQILGFCQEEIVEWHLTSVGTQDEIIPVHISGHTFLNRGKHQDILNLFPMSGESATVTMDNIGTWLLGTWDSRKMSNGMRLKFRDVKCDDYQQYDDEDYDGVLYNTVSFVTEKPEVVPTKTEQQKKERGTSPDSKVEDDYQDSLAADLGIHDTIGSKDVTRNEDDDYQDIMAAMLGLRTFHGSAAKEEEQNLTVLAIQDTYNISSLSDVDVTMTSDLEFTNDSEALHSVKLLEIQTTTSLPIAVESLFLNYTSLAGELPFSDITAVTTLPSEQAQSDHEVNTTYVSDNYSQLLEVKPLKSAEGRQSNDTAELLGVSTSVMPYEEEEQAENAAGEDGTLDRNRERRALVEAKLHAFREILALLLQVQQKRNFSCPGNTTSNLAFLAIACAENISSLNNLENDVFSYYYDEIEEEASTELPILLTNLTSTEGVTAKKNRSEPLHASELESSEVHQHDNLTLKGVLISTLIPVTEKKTQKVSLHKKQKCLSEKAGREWNVVSEESDIKRADLSWAIDNELQNNSKNATMYPENTMPSSKRNHKIYKGDTQLEYDKEVNNKQEGLNKKRHENCTINSPGTFLKIKRKRKIGALAPRTQKPLDTSKEVQHTRDASKANHAILLNKTSHNLTQNQNEPFVRIGLLSEDGDFREYDIENFDSEQTSSGSFEYQTVRYDNPYTTDSRLDINTVRNPDDIAVRYLRTFRKGNIKRYYIAAEEVLWDYAPFRKSTVKSDSANTRYTKVIFRSYQDDTFRTPEVGGEYEEHLGILGPVIRAEVDDVIQVQFKNKASRPYSLHAHGLSYEKSSEGRSYDDESPEWFKTDDAIKPNGTYTYVWHATKRSGPNMQDRRICRLWAYYSAVNPEKDIHSGLIGPILVCQKGMLDMFNRPIDMRAFVLLFMVFNEEKSWYFDKHGKKTHAQKISEPQRRHIYPAINGISYDLPGLLMYENEDVHWHMLNMGGPKDIHAINFHGQTFVEQEIEEHQLGVYPLFPGSFRTVKMKPPKTGIWLVDTEVGEYQEAGMQASFTVIDTGCKLPMGLESGIIQDSQISASGHLSYWEPKLARLNNAGKYNAWSIEKNENEYPWIQVDLERQAVITGIQTQGAKQLTKILYTKEYFITYSNDGKKWNAFKGNQTGTQKLFKGNSDARRVKENYFDPPIITRYIRVYPTKFFYRTILRMELLGCEIEGCFMPLGMESGTIKNAQITASSYKKNWISSWEPSLARLNLKGRVNAWQAKSNNNYQWLQIDLLQPKKVSAIATQGAKSLSTEMYVKSFSIAYSDDGSTWKSYLDTSTSLEKIFTGNINSSSQAKQFFSPPIFSRFIRIIPKTWNERIVLRIELFGCDVV